MSCANTLLALSKCPSLLVERQIRLQALWTRLLKKHSCCRPGSRHIAGGNTQFFSKYPLEDRSPQVGKQFLDSEEIPQQFSMLFFKELSSLD